MKALALNNSAQELPNKPLASHTDSPYPRVIDKGAPDAPFFYVVHKDATRVVDEPLSSSPI
jgi:hypothetical protein